jgi:hypothetical protein
MVTGNTNPWMKTGNVLSRIGSLIERCSSLIGRGYWDAPLIVVNNRSPVGVCGDEPEKSTVPERDVLKTNPNRSCPAVTEIEVLRRTARTGNKPGRETPGQPRNTGNLLEGRRRGVSHDDIFCLRDRADIRAVKFSWEAGCVGVIQGQGHICAGRIKHYRTDRSRCNGCCEDQPARRSSHGDGIGFGQSGGDLVIAGAEEGVGRTGGVARSLNCTQFHLGSQMRGYKSQPMPARPPQRQSKPELSRKLCTGHGCCSKNGLAETLRPRFDFEGPWVDTE